MVSKLTDKPAIGGGGTKPVTDYCTLRGAELLARRLTEYHAQRGQTIHCSVKPIPGKYGSARASNPMFCVRSDISVMVGR